MPGISVGDSATRADRFGQGLLLAALMFCSAPYSAESAADQTQRETYTCEDEQKRFESWSFLAGNSAESELLQQVPNSQIETVKAGDGRNLRGLHVRSKVGANDALLVIQGNAWSTKAFSPIAKLFPTNKFDIFMFDFRGYGLSRPGNPSISAILADYRDIATWLQTRGYRDLYVYAVSFGGVVALNAFPDGKPFRRIVLDSVVARASEMGFRCRVTYDSIDKIPSSCANITFMHGTNDWVVPRRYTQPLINAVRACGGALDVDESRGHPFQLEWESSIVRRVNAIVGHLKLQDAQ